jgi:hypothetical protein
MKRVLGLLVVLAVVLLVAGCAQNKTYYLTAGGTVNGYCEEVSSNNTNIQNALTLAGYTLGTCASQGFSTSGHTCAFSFGSGTTSYDITEYWGSSVPSSTIQSACTLAGGTYH